MPKDCTAIQIFVGSPADVQDERDRIPDIVAELNIHLMLTSNLFFHIIRYETHVYPDIASDAQEVVNKQIPQDYDIFLGIMWARLGTPTTRAPSGTVEEFHRAYERLRDRQKITIMFYFKTEGSFGKLADIDADQLAAAQAFKKWLPTIGALVGEFSDTRDFERKLRSSLRLHAHKFLSSRDSEDIGRVTAELGPGTRVNVNEWKELTTLTTNLQNLIQAFGHNLGKTIMQFAAISQPRIEFQDRTESSVALAEQDTKFNANVRVLKDKFTKESEKLQKPIDRNIENMLRLSTNGTISTKRAVSEAIMAAEEDLKKIGKIVDSFELRVKFFASVGEGKTRGELTDLSEAVRASVARLLARIGEIREETRGALAVL